MDLVIDDRELGFLLWDWLKLDARTGVDRETVNAVLGLSARLAADVFLTHYKEADNQEPFIDNDGQVHVLPAVAEAVRAYANAGLFGAGFAEKLGGMGLPCAVTTAAMARFMAANLATSAYPMLTVGNARLIATFGTPAQVDAFGRPAIAGRALGTMCLSEPQAGSALGDIRTRAEHDGEDGARDPLSFVRQQDVDLGVATTTSPVTSRTWCWPRCPALTGDYRTGRPASTVHRAQWLPDGARNDVAVAGLNHKMGYRGAANCLLNFGEGRETPGGAAGAVGWLVGQEGDGLRQMFQMMNEARINVGLGAAAVAYCGYRHAVAYARERLQGRAANASGPIAIVQHPDVQRMLLAQKAYSEDRWRWCFTARRWWTRRCRTRTRASCWRC